MQTAAAQILSFENSDRGVRLAPAPSAETNS